MGRIRNASERFSSARRNLIESNTEGGREFVLAALQDVAAGLRALERVTLPSPAMRSSFETLTAMIPQGRDDFALSDVLERLDRSRFSRAVDEMASWLYWRAESSH